VSDRVFPLARNVPKSKRKVSSAAKAYFVALEHDLTLFHLTIVSAAKFDYATFIAQYALDGKDAKDSPYADHLALAHDDPGPTTIEFRKHSQQFLEMFLARTVDNFQCYIVDLVREVLHLKPEILTNSQPSISMETLLNFSSKEEVVHHVIEKKVNSLAYQGFNELQDWCTERGIPIIPPAGKQYDLAEIIATRNIIVHNRGLVDEKYLKVVTNPSFKLGECRSLESTDFYDVSLVMGDCVRATDLAAVRKFKIPVVSCKEQRIHRLLREDHDNQSTHS